MATAADKQLDQTKELIVAAVQEMHLQQQRTEDNNRYERQELRRWGIEQAVASFPDNIATSGEQLIIEARKLIEFVKGEE